MALTLICTVLYLSASEQWLFPIETIFYPSGIHVCAYLYDNFSTILRVFLSCLSKIKMFTISINRDMQNACTMISQL